MASALSLRLACVLIVLHIGYLGSFLVLRTWYTDTVCVYVGEAYRFELGRTVDMAAWWLYRPLTALDNWITGRRWRKPSG
jgi:hypothetical protein